MECYKGILRTAHVFYSVGQLPIKPSSKQIVIHLRHGNANFKTIGFNTNIKMAMSSSLLI